MSGDAAAVGAVASGAGAAVGWPGVGWAGASVTGTTNRGTLLRVGTWAEMSPGKVTAIATPTSASKPAVVARMNEVMGC